MRGGVSTLRAWTRMRRRVFSPCVEVFPTYHTAKRYKKGFLHVRGGVSDSSTKSSAPALFSPRAWRCFHSAMMFFLRCQGFLHMRGGVSPWSDKSWLKKRFSPHAWRCFQPKHPPPRATTVFSTCVEVFPSARASAERRSRFLHMRGGVSPLTFIVSPI